MKKTKLIFLLGFPWVAGVAWAGPVLRPYQAENYRIQMSLDPASDATTFSATLTMTLKATQTLKTVTLDRDELDIDKVTSKGKRLKFQTPDAKSIVVDLASPLKKGSETTFTIAYRGKVRSENNGFFKVRDPDDAERGPLYFTMFEATSARQFYPCDDQPFDKARTETVVSVPEGYQVISNGNRLSDRRFSKEGKTWHEVHWRLNEPQSTYLVSLAIGRFAEAQKTVGGHPLAIWVGKKNVGKTEYALDVTGKALSFYENYTGVEYPWPKYDQIGIPTFLWGGMENTSATHMNELRFLVNDPRSESEKSTVTELTAHELAHQWFGDYVTMKWWNDVWLNESFASLMATRATAAIFHNEEAEIQSRLSIWDSYFHQEDGPRSHPIVDSVDISPDDAFDSINYDKGESVLRMLSYDIGEEKFRAGLKLYLTLHAFGNATNEDLFAAMEKASGKDLKAFRESWLLRRGYPIVQYRSQWDKGTGTYTVTVNQVSNHPEDHTVFHFHLPVVFHRVHAPAYAKEVTLAMDSAQEEARFHLDAEPEWISVNPNSEVLAKVEPAERNEDELALQAHLDPEPMARVWANYALMQGLLEDEKISSSAEKALVVSLQDDKSPYVRTAILKGIQRMKTRWLPERLGNAVFSLAKDWTPSHSEMAEDAHGYPVFHSQLLAAVGRVQSDDVLPFLSQILARRDLPLDDLTEAAYGAAAYGSDKSDEVLQAALKAHESRGYAYRMAVLSAFGAYESPLAAKAIKSVGNSLTPDFWGRIGWVIQSNETLKTSAEWADFLRGFILNDLHQGDEVKTRLLETVEDVKTKPVQDMLQSLMKDSSSDRVKEFAKKILEKNFRS